LVDSIAESQSQKGFWGRGGEICKMKRMSSEKKRGKKRRKKRKNRRGNGGKGIKRRAEGGGIP